MKSKNGRKRRLILVYVSAFLIVLMACFFAIPSFEKSASAPVEGSADWMRDIPDSTPLNMITIPGTHDSATANVHLAFFSRCQSRSISEQLNDGFRYLDIRLGTDSENDKITLKLMHGFTSCRKKASLSSGKLYLDNVLAQCYAFLDLHPYETIVFAVKQEHGDESVSTFENLLNSYISQDSEYWLLTDDIPTMGEARGRLVLMRRYADEAELGAEAGIPLCWEDQSGFDDPDLSFEENTSGTFNLWVQDRYEFDNEEKWLSFITTLGTCPADYASGDLCINFLSTKGALTYGHPYSHAKVLNSKFSEISLNPGVPYGWIILDFGSPELARCIYSCNFIP